MQNIVQFFLANILQERFDNVLLKSSDQTIFFSLVEWFRLNVFFLIWIFKPLKMFPINYHFSSFFSSFSHQDISYLPTFHRYQFWMLHLWSLRRWEWDNLFEIEFDCLVLSFALMSIRFCLETKVRNIKSSEWHFPIKSSLRT